MKLRGLFTAATWISNMVPWVGDKHQRRKDGTDYPEATYRRKILSTLQEKIDKQGSSEWRIRLDPRELAIKLEVAMKLEEAKRLEEKEKPEEAGRLEEKARKLKAAADILEQVGRLKEAAEMLRQVGRPMEAADKLEQVANKLQDNEEDELGAPQIARAITSFRCLEEDEYVYGEYDEPLKDEVSERFRKVEAEKFCHDRTRW